MKIRNLKIEGYKNLNIELVHNSDIIALIGNNGSGKSNLLEALSLIFKSLYVKGETVSFDYSIEYVINEITNVKINKEKSKIVFKVNEIHTVSIDEYLPKKVIAIYSGEEQRLWNKIYFPIYDEFIKGINLSKHSGLLINKGLMPKMLYLNKNYWHICLLSLLISDLEDNKKFIKEVLKINSVEKIKFDFNKSNYKNYTNSLIMQFIDTIDKKNEYTLTEFKELIELIYSESDIFNYLYIANSPKGTKIIENITILYNEHLTIEDFSEGEKKLLLIRAAFEFAEQEDSLFILDEPDAHIHLNNKDQIIKTFEPYKDKRQIVITTHSPTVTQAIDDDNCLFMVNSGKIIERKKQEILSDLTSEFWNKHQQSSFLSSKKDLILLVEGKHDKLHISNAIEKLKEDYPTLDFDIFSMGGASNIPQLITGLRTSDTKLNKLIIAIFDNDDEGKDNCNKTQVSYNGQVGKLHKFGFFAIKYENDKKIKEGDGLTVENMFDSNFYEEAFKEALFNHTGKFENKYIDKITKEIKDDAKTILANKSKSLLKEDFKHFRKLFDLILEIKNINNNTQEIKADEQKNEIIVEVKTDDKIEIPPIDIKSFGHHKKYTSKKTWENFLTLRESLIKNNPVINFYPNKYFISLYVDKKNIAVIRFRKKEMNIEMKSREEQVKQFLPNRNIRKRVNGIVVDNIKENDDFTDVLNMITELSKIRN